MATESGAVELATAYISLVPSMKGAKKKITEELGGAAPAGEAAGRTIGSRITKGLKWAAIGAGVATAGIITKGLVSGFKRLTAIEDARNQLSSLGHSAKTVQTVMDNALASVKGTAFGLGEAATTASGAVAAGVKPGKDLQRVLGLVADTAEIAGTDMASMGAIFNKVAATNKIQGEVIAQLGERGIPVISLLGKELNKSGEEVIKLASEGKINFKTFADAMEAGLGGAALAAGSTVTSSFANMNAALSRFGAALLEGIYPHIQPVLGFLTEKIDEATAAVGPLAEKFAEWLPQAFEKVAVAARNTVQWIKDNAGWLVTLTAATTGWVLAMKAITIVQAVTKWVKAFTLAQIGLNAALLANPIGIVIGVLAGLVAAVVWAYNEVDWFRELVDNAFKWIQDVVRGVVDWFTGTAVPVWNTAIALLGAFFTRLWEDWIKPAFDAIGAVFTWLWTNIVRPIFTLIGDFIRVWWQLASGVFQIAIAFFQKVLAPMFRWFWTDIIRPVFNWIGEKISWFWNSIGRPVFSAVHGFIRNTLGPIFQWLWNRIISPIWNTIGAVIGSVWRNKIKPVFDTLNVFISEVIPDAFRDGVRFVRKIWDGIIAVVSAPINFVIDTIINDGIIGAFNTVAGWLGIAKIDPVYNPVRAAQMNGRVGRPAGYADGGYTGPGGKYQPAGIVHAGEWVFTKEQTRAAGTGTLAAFAKYLDGYAAGGLVHPLPGAPITSGYGPRAGGFHNGIDYGAPMGALVRAAGLGSVIRAGWTTHGGGNQVEIMHPGGLVTWYSHLSRILTATGALVKAGQVIGRVGSTGNSTGPHLHFMTMHGGYPNYFNPAAALSGNVPAGDGGSGFWNPIGDLVSGLLDSIRDKFPAAGFITDMAVGVGKKLIDGLTAWAGNAIGIGAPTLFDGGGWLENTGRPQFIDHKRRKPDAVLTNEQWAMAEASLLNGGGDTWQLYGIPMDNAEETARAIMFEKRRRSAGAYARMRK